MLQGGRTVSFRKAQKSVKKGKKIKLSKGQEYFRIFPNFKPIFGGFEQKFPGRVVWGTSLNKVYSCSLFS